MGGDRGASKLGGRRSKMKEVTGSAARGGRRCASSLGRVATRGDAGAVKALVAAAEDDIYVVQVPARRALARRARALAGLSCPRRRRT